MIILFHPAQTIAEDIFFVKKTIIITSAVYAIVAGTFFVETGGWSGCYRTLVLWGAVIFDRIFNNSIPCHDAICIFNCIYDGYYGGGCC